MIVQDKFENDELLKSVTWGVRREEGEREEEERPEGVRSVVSVDWLLAASAASPWPVLSEETTTRSPAVEDTG